MGDCMTGLGRHFRFNLRRKLYVCMMSWKYCPWHLDTTSLYNHFQ